MSQHTAQRPTFAWPDTLTNRFNQRVFLIALAAFLFRILKANFYRAWADEYLTMGYVEQYTLVEHFTTLPIVQPHFPTYYLTLKGWLLTVGWSWSNARVLSALYGFLGILAVALLAREIATETTGLIAAATLAVNPFHAYLSQTIRMYSAFIAIAAVSWLCWFKLRRNTTREHTVLYVASALLLGYIHVFGYFIVFAQLSILAALTIRNRDIHLLSAGTAVCLGLLPGALLLLYRVFLAPTPDTRGSLEAIPHVVGKPGLYDAGAVMVRMLIGRINYYPELIALVLLVAGIFAGLYHHAQRHREQALSLAAWVLIPVLVSAIVSHLVFALWDWNQARYLSGIMPPLVVLFALGVDALDDTPLLGHPHAGKIVLLVPVVLLSSTTVWLGKLVYLVVF